MGLSTYAHGCLGEKHFLAKDRVEERALAYPTKFTY